MNIINEKGLNVYIDQCDSLDEAQLKASKDSVNTSGTVIPGILFRQGGRHCFSAALSMAQVMDKLDIRAAEKMATAKQVGDATNRPTDPTHVKTISEYIKANVSSKYIIPPLTLNVQQTMRVFSSSRVAATSVAYAVLPSTAKLQITDGSHRKKAIYTAYAEMSDEERENFFEHSVSVMITFEGENAQVQQDFADCSKTKLLPPGLIAAYDRRNPANGLVLDLIDAIPLFYDKIDSTSKTLSKNSNMLFLVNHIKAYVKELLVGDWAMANAAFDKKALTQIKSRNTQDYSDNLEKFISLTKRFVEVIQPWQDLENLPRGTERMKIAAKRNEGWISMTAVGLALLGRVGFIILRDKLSEYEQADVFTKLSKIDMRKDAEFWQGNIIIDGRIATSRAPVKKAMKKLLSALDIGEKDLLDQIND